MLTDPIATAGLVTREVRTSTRQGAPTRIAIARRRYETDVADLWDALTNPERIPRWFLPVSGELKEGGRYQTEGNAGGVVERCDAPNSFSVTWEMGPAVSWLTVRLAAVDGGTSLELVHEAPVEPGFWEQFGPGAVGVGWDLAIMALGLHLESGEAVDPAEGQAYPLTPGGTSFVAHAARDWGQAAANDGDDRDAALAAAERTIAFYTTMPDAQ
jgi:uncharacterized protein YndB with AHSA1/START domain